MTRCPACSELNPNDHQFCGYCGNRLSTPAHNEPTLPAWLADDANATQPTPAEQTPLQAAETDADAPLPAWLRNVEPVAPNVTPPVEQHGAERTSPLAERDGSSDPNKTAPDLPFWLSEVHNGTAADTDRSPAAAQAHHSDDQSAPTAQGSLSEDALPAWLRDDAAFSSTPPATLGQADRPADAQTTQPELPVPTTTASDDALPPWLFAETAATGDQDTTPAFGNASPRPRDGETAASAQDQSLDWLKNKQAAPAAPPAPSANAADELPDWLRDDTNSIAPAQPDAATTQELPAWLRDDPFVSMSQDTSAPAQPPAPAADYRATARSASDSLPAWLRDDEFTLQEPNPVSAPEPAPTKAPEDTLVRDSGANAPDTGTAANETRPAWLHDQASPAAGDSSATLPLEVPSSDGTEAVPAGSVRVYDTPANEPAPLTTDATPAPEPQPSAGAAVYDAPADTLPSEADIAALLATPTATPTDTPAETTPTAEPPQAQTNEAPAIPPAAPPRPTPVMPPQQAQRSYSLWIVLAVVLLLAVLAVGWLALRANGFF